MVKTCLSCGREFEAKRAAAKFCGDTCRQRAKRSGATLVPLGTPEPNDDDSPLISAVRTTLDEAGVLETVSGQSALLLAQRLSSPFETGAAMAALSKQLEALVSSALASVKRADQMDEVTRRRDEKLRRAGRA